MTGVAIWTIWEVTVGFLIMGIPAFPKAFMALPKSDSIVSFFRTLSRRSQRSGSEMDVPQNQFYKPRTRQRRGLWEISELETHDLVTMTTNNDGSTIVEQASTEVPEISVIVENKVQV
jgi:hypothetical protein